MAEIFLASLRRWLDSLQRRLVANTLARWHQRYLAVQQLRLINDKHARVLTNCLLPLMSTILLILTAMNSIVKLWRAVFKGIYFTRYIRRSNKLFKWLNWYRACFERRRPRVRFYFFLIFILFLLIRLFILLETQTEPSRVYVSISWASCYRRDTTRGVSAVFALVSHLDVCPSHAGIVSERLNLS